MISELAVVLYVNTCWTGVQHSIASVRAGASALEDTNETNGSGVLPLLVERLPCSLQPMKLVLRCINPMPILIA